MKRRKLLVTAIALFVISGIGIWFVRGAGANSATPYRLGEVRYGTVESTVTSTGRLNALRSVAVGTQVSGRITELHADYNDRVREGQLLARIDPTLQRQAVRNAEANLERVRAALLQAERDHQRNRTLYEQQVITETEFSQVEYSLTVARSNVTSAEVSLEQARQNLAYTEIYAPIDGIVVERNVEPGQTVAASLSAPQLYLLAADLSSMEILANVDESDIGEIKNGMPVRFTVQAYPTSTFEGVVRQVRLSSSTQENVVNYTAVISVPNPDMRLLPGMTAAVDFIVERAENVLTVPNAALRFRATEDMIAQLRDPAMIALARGGSGAANRARGEVGRAAGEGAAQSPPSALEEGVSGVVAAGPGQVGRDARTELAPGSRGAGGSQRAAGPGQMPRAADRSGGEAAPDSGPFVPGGTAAAPADSRPTFANLWFVRDGELGIARVRTGVSDGSNTEISGPDLEEGMEIVIGLSQPQAGSSATTNPFQQGGGGGGFGPPGGGFGGPGGGGGFGGGGGRP